MKDQPSPLLVASLACLLGGACTQTSARPANVNATSAPPAAPDAATEADDPALLRAVGILRQPASVACEPGELPPRRPLAAAPDGGASDGGRSASSAPHGSLDKELIRQAIRRQLGAVKSCYESVLVAEPYPTGRVVTRILIAETGEAKRSCIVSTTLNQAEAEACIAEAVLKWDFPKPLGGGVVVVDYPFVFNLGEEPRQ